MSGLFSVIGNAIIYLGLASFLLITFSKWLSPIFYYLGQIWTWFESPLHMFSNYLTTLPDFVFLLWGMLPFVIILLIIRKFFIRAGN